MFMKTILITVSAAAVALWGGFTIGYHSGVRDTEAIWQSMVPDGKHVVLKEPPQPRGSGHVNSYPDPGTSK
jgi:hypothetical protein